MARKLKPTTEMEKAADDQPVTKAPKGSRVASNVTDETIAEHYQKALAAQLEVESATASLQTARGILGAVLKDAKTAGVDTTALRTVLRWRKRETPELDAEIRAINRVAYVAKLPIGAQLGLFDQGTTVATAIDSAAIAKAAIPTTDELDRATADGRAAGLRDLPVSDCPHPDGSPLALRWLAARKDAVVEAERVRKMSTRAVKAKPAKSAEDLAGEAASGMAALRDGMKGADA